MAAYAFGPYLFSDTELALTCHGQGVPMRPRTAQVLGLLLARASQLVSKNDLLEALWPNSDVEEANITQHIFLLRRLFAYYTPDQTYVVTEPRRGYRFVAQVSEVQTIRAQPSAAWNLVVRGRFFADQRRRVALLEALKAFDRAIALDARCAPAYAGLAECHVLRAEYLFTEPGPAFDAARKAATHALSIDPSLAEPHAALGEVAFFHERDDAAALAHYDRAIQLDPASLPTRIDRAWFFAVKQQPERADGEIEIASRIEPFSLKVLTMHAAVRIFARDFDFVERRCRDVLEMDPTYTQASYYRAAALAYSGSPAAALEVLERYFEGEYTQQFLAISGYAAARAGLNGIAEDALRRLDEMAATAYVSSFNTAHVLVGLGRLDEARRRLALGAATGDPWAVFVAAHPAFDDIR